jgi:hypothetical protein
MPTTNDQLLVRQISFMPLLWHKYSFMANNRAKNYKALGKSR